MINNWRNCGNCIASCEEVIRRVLAHYDCEFWTPIQCKYCGGLLSEIREHNGRKYRHCYSCHAEFFVEVTACDTTGI